MMTLKTGIIDDALHYLQYLINEVLRQTGLSSDITKGLVAFDPFIMFRRPMVEGALRLFDLFYSTFCLRSWVTKANESAFRDQYIQVLHHLRVCYGPNFDISSTFQNVIDFLLGLDFFQSRDHVFYHFKLCCLCATTPSSAYPDVTAGCITTVGHQSRFTDLSEVPGWCPFPRFSVVDILIYKNSRSQCLLWSNILLCNLRFMNSRLQICEI